ncbi:MAG TPA: hypothetical protein G4O11_03680 [Anaerolineae bacterium]|nr:hypothetical protein [Anaerolineae bacterium]
MQPHEYNLKMASFMLEEIEDYLLSSEVFWPLSKRMPVGPPLPRLTLGGLILTLDELNAQEKDLSPSQASELYKLRLQMEKVRTKWTVGLERKATQEVRSRLNLWRAYLVDIEERVETPENYIYEVRYRVMFERLASLAIQQPEIKPQVEEMRSLDLRLRKIFVPGAFVWDPRLEDIYPRDTFWYLYGLPRPR